MKKNLFAIGLALLVISSVTPAFAVKQLNDQFKVVYAGENADAGFVALITEAKCNVCHTKAQTSKKVRNDYGKALHDALEKDEFPIKEFKTDPEKFAERLKVIFKKIEEEKSADEKLKTFGARIKANLLPGGNVDGANE